MAIDIDGYAVLGAIARKPDSFPAIKNEVSKVARTLVVKQLKEKSTAVGVIRSICSAIDAEAFDLILDLMTDAEIKSLINKVDKLNTEAKSESPQWQRKHVSELAQSHVEPAVKRALANTEKPKAKNPTVERAASARFSKARKKV